LGLKDPFVLASQNFALALSYWKHGLNDMNTIDRLLSAFPLYSEDLEINLSLPAGRFQWFLASILFGARISEKIACKTFRVFLAEGVDSPEKILSAGWDRLVRILDAGGYVRYDFSTATKLINVMSTMMERYGSLDELYQQSSDTKDLEKRLKEFYGIGPATVQIFLREMRGVWEINPEVSSRAVEMAECLGINLGELSKELLARVETGLVKLHLRCCKKKKCLECSFSECPRRVSLSKN
jgi:endonuclease III